MKLHLFAVFVGLLFSVSQSLAAMTLISISGASNQDLSTPTKPIIYAGFTGTCTGDGVSTCDSCLGANGGSSLVPCNMKNVYPSLKLNIQMSTTTTGVTSADAFVKIDGERVSGTTQTLTDGVLSTQLAWADICNHSKVGQGTGCTGSFYIEMSVGVEATSGGTTTTDSMTFKIVARVAATDGSETYYTDCNTADATDNIGFCHFEVYPGDSKIYADNMVVAPGYPSSPASGVEYSNVVFFYAQQLSGEDDNTTIQRITNQSDAVVIGVNKSASPPIADNRIDGLTNDTRYCMIMANQDVTGIISYFTPPPGTPSSPVTAAELCTSPSEVVGLLDDKHCFIATAAFGSDMAPEVQALRVFRNKFLLTSSVGRFFVNLYYKHSPYFASLIAESDLARGVVRFFLWPFLLFAQMSVAFGVWLAIVVWSLGVLSVVQLLRRFFIGARFRGEL